MIKKLRRKFILINMLLVTIILLAVLVTLFFTSSRRYEREMHGAMLQATQPGRMPPERKIEFRREPSPDQPHWRGFTPMFVVTLDQHNQITDTSVRNLEVDDDTVRMLTDLALAKNPDEGRLRDYNLCYLKMNTPDGFKIVFADQSAQIANLRALLLNCLLIFAGGTLAFFALSLYLSRWALAPVEKAWKQQGQFVADASHELKTPLTVILANLKILSSHKTETIQSQKKWLDNTQEEANRMKQLVEDLLFLAKSDAQAAPAVMADVDLSNLAWERVLLFESVAFEQNLTLDSEIAPGIRLKGNESQLKQLLTILLDNGCKYAGKGGSVTVVLKKDQDKIRISVNNSGEPIPPEDIPHLFERFYRADKSRVRQTGGYGLGLSIAKSIVEGHHGRISAESSEKAGTTFTVVL